MPDRREILIAVLGAVSFVFVFVFLIQVTFHKKGKTATVSHTLSVISLLLWHYWPMPPASLNGDIGLCSLALLRWQAQLLSFQHFCDIKVEEVTIQDGLDHPSHDGDHVKEALEVEPPDPVEEVKSTVDPQGEQIVGSDGLGFSGLADQEELRQNGH